MTKQILLKSLTITFVFLLGVYLVTLYRLNSNNSARLPFGESKIFYIQRSAGINFYQAGAPFLSTYTYFDNSAGCPCFAKPKPFVILPMIFTWEFILNLFIWLLPTLGLAYVINKNYENTRD